MPTGSPVGIPAHNVHGNALSSGSGISGHHIVMTLTIELIGVGLMAAIADTGETMGKTMVGLMAGFFIIWFLLNSSYFSSILGKAQKYETP